MGSRILSRSFDVERIGTDEEEEADNSIGSAMDVDIPEAASVAEDTAEAQDEIPSEDDDSEEEDSVDVSMVPIADLLNVRCQFINVSENSDNQSPRLDLAPRTYVSVQPLRLKDLTVSVFLGQTLL